MIRADDMLHSGSHRDVILASFARRGIEPQGLGGWQLATNEIGIAGHVENAE
jgi:hypothetical protein